MAAGNGGEAEGGLGGGDEDQEGGDDQDEAQRGGRRHGIFHWWSGKHTMTNSGALGTTEIKFQSTFVVIKKIIVYLHRYVTSTVKQGQ